MKVEIQQLSTNCGQAEFDLLQTIENGENGFSNPVYERSYEDYLVWLQKEDDYSRANSLPNGWIPETTYFLYAESQPVGFGRIRHRTSEALESIGVGNLAYAIGKPFRGKGFGNILLEKLLEKSAEIGYKQIKLFPYKDNIPTVKVMLKNGGEIIDSFEGEKYVIVIPVKNRPISH